MDVLKTKSANSVAAAKKLKAECHHNSSVHCAYYSCVQLAKYILIHKLGKASEVELNKKFYHKWYIDEIRDQLKKKKGQLTAVDFQLMISGLKTLRDEADYSETETIADKSKVAVENADKINNILINAFCI